MIGLPLVTTALALAGGLAGFRLIPDTGLYSRDGFHLWPAPLSNIGGILAGTTGVVVLSALAAGGCVLLVRRRKLFTAGAAYWFLFPGVDALGTLFVLAGLRARSSSARFSRSSGGLAFLAGGLVHPVNALTTAPLLWRRDTIGLALCALVTLSTIVTVGLLDGFSTTDRYALPLLAALCGGVRP